MPARPLTLTQSQARRLAVSRQHLAAARPSADADGLRTVCRALRFLQLDPVNVLARSHELVLWSRLGAQGVGEFEQACWRDRWLFEYWTHAAATVLAEDYPLHRAVMDAYPDRGRERIEGWITANDELRRHVLERLAQGEPLPTDAFEDRSVVDWASSGWTNGRNVERMLGLLWRRGEVMIAGRSGGRRLWGLPTACLPADVVREPLPPRAVVTTAIEHTLRARGIARALDIRQYFVPGQYADLPGVLDALVARDRIQPVRVEGGRAGETWYVHADALAELDAIRADDWAGRTALLSPFDNMINDRRLTERLWGFDFRNEMYVPKARRTYGYYLLPILHGDRLVGRVEPRVDRRRRVLAVAGLWLEPDVRATAALRRAVTGELADLAAFVGATAVEYGEAVPPGWR
ncbi:winged helix-turn-helix domain-containing protein [Kitasatospora sp. NPDC058965]|uniref:winged helix-turn-helix domain-containing protein n=1 Tax=Kitasatospora sp. NPDC058965 TaxID=3346682 RepID=UPI0036AB9082